ncbi:MAG: hypothetical protein NXH79_06940 [Rhodobacteraceae bacterium]|nr:hypothetical protein [Paracoccaceae bacterium]
MTGLTRRDLPADLAVFAGDFTSQPVVYAHLLDSCPALDPGEVEVIQTARAARLGAFFHATTVAEIETAAGAANTLVLIKPDAFDDLTCPLNGTDLLRALGTWRGTVPRMVAAP